MANCAKCGRGNPDGFRFCGACGAALDSPGSPPDAEVRKTVTIVFCDVVGSTAMGESLDPEAVRRVMARYFDRMREAVERHGGTVEKFIGDAVMAVFGLPAVHEDDAVRALRAAAEMRDAIPDLGIEGRIGVNTGEVVTGTEERLVTGDAVNVAARLEQAAQPGEVLVGEATMHLAGNAALAEPVEPLELKGKSERVPAWRLVSVAVEDAARRTGSPLVGRGRELRALDDAWARVGADGRCEFVTVIGDAGAGKSRLVDEFLGQVDATVVRGRCLSYGEGITYWPVLEVLKQIEPSQADLELDVTAAETLRGLFAKEGTTSTDEIAWAFRKLLEAVAADRALVAVFDDIQWGEEAFLDLLEHIAYLSSGAPILLCCMGRPDLLESRPGWGGVLRLDPLAPEEVGRLIDARLGGREIEPGVRERILTAAGGNPLFVEEMAAMLQESGSGAARVPPTIQALLAARLDQLERAERRVLERAAVEGDIFHRGAVQTLAPEESRLTARLTSLVRKELIRPDKEQFPGEDAFRFRHLLIRDAAYDSLPKALRADLHEQFALWLEERAHDLVELDEILGYHLERAFLYRAEFGPGGEEGQALAKRAAVRLSSAGQRAFSRGDMPGAANLLARTVALLPRENPDRAELLPDLATALAEIGELSRADSILEEAIEDAHAARDERLEWRARLGRSSVYVSRGGSFEEGLAVAEQAIEAFVRLGDDLGLARAWNLVALYRFWLGTTAAAEHAWQSALQHAGRARSPGEEAQALSWLLIGTWYGPTPGKEGIKRCREILERSPTRQVEALAFLEQASLLAMIGRFSEARELFQRGKQMLEELGLVFLAARASQERFDIEKLAGDPAAAEIELRQACEILERLGEKGFLSTRAACLGHVLCAQGRHADAEPFIELAAQAASEDDVMTQTLWRSAKAKMVAARGDFDEALRLARQAVAIVERTDWLNAHGDALVDLAEVLGLAGLPHEATPVVEEALRLYEQKGNVVSAGKSRAVLEELAKA